ncbi:MAG: hypothetical protein HUU21_38190, partial [Polyangiaceae bacterium]|nr:hypothetical protein [Polyangiaceae bacterium]
GDPDSEGGCGCRTVGSESNSQGGLWLAGLLAAAVGLRRRARRAANYFQ